MLIISNLKEKFGQDLPYLQRRITELNNELNGLMQYPTENQSEITYRRGKLLKYLRQAIDLTQDPAAKQNLEQALNNEINTHKRQLDSRIRYNKKAETNSLPTELGLKINKAINSFKQISLSQDKQELMGNIVKGVGNTLSIAGTVAKLPAIGITKLLKSGSTLTAKILTAPLHIGEYYFSKLINPDSPYKGTVVNKMSDGLGNMLKALMDKQEQAIRRI